MEVEDIRPGMTGYGLSVFEGTEPRRFAVTVRGVLKNRFAGGDMIIIESDDPIMEGIGGVAGMSGSPIFIEDKLIGAFAYGWGFSVRPINGVTPIRDMLKVMELVTTESKVSPDEVPASMAGWEEARAELNRRFPSLPNRSYAAAEVESLGIGVPSTDDSVTFQPLGTPLLASTRSPRVMAELDRLFEGTALRPVMAGLQGGAVGDARGNHENLKPVNGGALSVIIAEGDLALAGLGTTTYVQDDRLIAFGHPMMASGATDMPIAVSDVVTVVPSVARPFKMGNALKTVGALRQDRLPAVAASLTAPAPRLMPLSVSVVAPENNVDRTFQYRLLNDRNFMPMITFICLMESMESIRFGGPLAMDYQYSVRLNDGRTIEATEFVSGEIDAALEASFNVAMTLMTLAGNPFKAPGIDSVSVSMKIGDRNKMMVFDDVTRRVPSRIEPGDTLGLDLEYVRWRKERVDLPVRVRLPENLRPGSYTLRVIDGRERLQLEYRLRPELRDIDSYDRLVNALQPNFPGNQAYVVLLDNTADPAINGQIMPSMPSSISATTQATMRRNDGQSTTPGRLVLEERLPVDGMLLGGTTLTFTVEPRRPR